MNISMANSIMEIIILNEICLIVCVCEWRMRA